MTPNPPSSPQPPGLFEGVPAFYADLIHSILSNLDRRRRVVLECGHVTDRPVRFASPYARHACDCRSQRERVRGVLVHDVEIPVDHLRTVLQRRDERRRFSERAVLDEVRSVDAEAVSVPPEVIRRLGRTGHTHRVVTSCGHRFPAEIDRTVCAVCGRLSPVVAVIPVSPRELYPIESIVAECREWITRGRPSDQALAAQLLARLGVEDASP